MNKYYIFSTLTYLTGTITTTVYGNTNHVSGCIAIKLQARLSNGGFRIIIKTKQ